MTSGIFSDLQGPCDLQELPGWDAVCKFRHLDVLICTLSVQVPIKTLSGVWKDVQLKSRCVFGVHYSPPFIMTGT